MDSDKQSLDRSILDDLQLHGGLELTQEEYDNLAQYGTLFMEIERIKPYFDKLRNYMAENSAVQRGCTIARVQDVSCPYIFGYLLLASVDKPS